MNSTSGWQINGSDLNQNRCDYWQISTRKDFYQAVRILYTMLLRKYDVPAKNSEIFDLNNSTYTSFVMLVYMCQQRNLHQSLLNQFRWFFYYFQGEILSILMIKHLQNLAKSTFINRVNNLIPIGNMIPLFISIEIPN